MTQRTLGNRSIFLSASVPNESQSDIFSQVPDAAYQIEQAVVSLVRSVLNAGGRLVFGGHPSISSLVATIATQYPKTDNSRVAIYQSRAFENVITDDTKLLRDLGFATLEWTDAMDGERFDPEKKVPANIQCRKSLRYMRQTLIDRENPIAMVCIGGMQGVLDEAHLFSNNRLLIGQAESEWRQRQKQSAQIYTFLSTGGAARLLASGEERIGSEVKILDKRFQTDFDQQDLSYEPEDQTFNIIPFPYIMQNLVSEIGSASS